jgi:Hint-domain
MDNIPSSYNTSKSASIVMKMYKGLTYLDQYGTSVIIFIVISIVLFVIVSYFQVIRQVQPIKDDWINQRCKPQVIPFAGIINKPPDKTVGEFTSENFTYCIQTLLSNISSYALTPIEYIVSGIKSLFSDIVDAIQSIRNILSSVRKDLENISQEILAKILNFLIPIQKIIIAFSDAMNKVKGILTAGLYTSLGSYFAIQSFFEAVMQFIITLLIVLSVLIVGMWLIPFTWPVAATTTVVFASIAIPLAIILNFMEDILRISSGRSIPKIPSRPSCFDAETLVKMSNGEYKNIKDILVGDVLDDGNTVNSVLKLSSQIEIQKMYNLEGIIVSSKHPVFFEKTNKWIPVEEHPKSILVKEYTKPLLYCLCTTDKRIKIGNHTFLDWDEVKDNVNFSDDMFLSNTNGLNNNTKIKLSTKIVKIRHIEIGDLIENDNKVIGIVEIKNNLGNENLFHLITEKQYFYIYNEGCETKLKYNDYDYNIELFLEQCIL